MSWNLEGGRPAEILLVEDNEDDAVLTRMGLARIGRPVNVHHVLDGDACLRLLRRQPPYEQAPRIDLVLLDLNMPGLDGRATLSEIVADEALRHIPVIVLTTSTSEADIAAMYRLRCGGYVVKPLELGRFFDVVKEICSYWFTTVRLPRPR